MLTCDVDTLWFSEDEESAGKRKQLDSDNDSSDSEDENDGTWTENGTEKKIKKKKKPKGKVSDSESNDSDSVSRKIDVQEVQYFSRETNSMMVLILILWATKKTGLNLKKWQKLKGRKFFMKEQNVVKLWKSDGKLKR